ncbi:GTPase [Maribacter sp. 2210JD10-5]|uniref:GTPase n=1 Tax=Maribacter sp. 2210JD10-5 TaxID=3386272 RepID=UPI0039BC52A9
MKNLKIQKLIFVYNADSGLGNLLIDGAHKIVSPKTYACSLCDITYGAFTEKSIWKKFRKELILKGYELDFLHKDEFIKSYRSKFSYKFSFPIILASTGDNLEVLVSTTTLNQVETPEELIKKLRELLE